MHKNHENFSHLTEIHLIYKNIKDLNPHKLQQNKMKTQNLIDGDAYKHQ